jgi:hypothetical protein
MMTNDQKNDLVLAALHRIRSDRTFPYFLRWFLFGLGVGILWEQGVQHVLRICCHYLQ